MIHAAGIIQRHLDNVLTYINYPLTNAVTEGLNAKIQWIKYSSRGFRNRASSGRSTSTAVGSI
jgi:transposase